MTSKAFQNAKKQWTSGCVLTHYNPSLPITLAADASAYGVGVVISHTFPDGSQRPIAFASCTLTSAKKELYSNRKGSSGTNFWCYKVSPLPLWE